MAWRWQGGESGAGERLGGGGHALGGPVVMDVGVPACHRHCRVQAGLQGACQAAVLISLNAASLEVVYVLVSLALTKPVPP